MVASAGAGGRVCAVELHQTSKRSQEIEFINQCPCEIVNVERSVQVAAERKTLLLLMEVLNTLDSLKSTAWNLYIYIYR